MNVGTLRAQDRCIDYMNHAESPRPTTSLASQVRPKVSYFHRNAQQSVANPQLGFVCLYGFRMPSEASPSCPACCLHNAL